MKSELPRYYADLAECERYRLTYRGGRDFVNTYLKKYSKRESNEDFADRREMSYCPGFAASALEEIVNAIVSHLPDVARLCDSKTYKAAILGQAGGVDYKGAGIDSFIGSEVLLEMAMMKEVGVYVDMPTDVPSVRTSSSIHPYFYIYQREDIQAIEYAKPGAGYEYEQVLLRRRKEKYDDDYHLITGYEDEYLLLTHTDSGIEVRIFDAKNEETSNNILDLPKIPFTIFSLKHSLLKDAADYQIALLNLESTDINFLRKANFPVFVEQVNFPQNLPNAKAEEDDDEDVIPENKVEYGVQTGIRYGRNMSAPAFINPSPEPTEVAMEKEAQIKRDIRLLVHLAVSSLGGRVQSAESKEFDKQGLENGLAKIALVLEEGERKLIEFWQAYESINKEVYVQYPRQFDLRTDKDRRDEAKELSERAREVPSMTFQKEMMKRVTTTLMSNHIRPEVLEKIHKEIDDAPSMTSDAKTVLADFEAGLVSAGTASKIRGYAEEEVIKAQEEHAERVKMISEAQGGLGGEARGVDDTQIDQDDSSTEKKGKAKRGEAKL